MQAVRPGPSPAVLRSAATAEASEVSRFSCMKCLGVSGVYDYAGLNRDSRLRLCPCCLPLDQQRRHPDLVFSKLDTQPTYSPVYASSYTSRCTTQNSGPSGSLLLPRKNFPFSASCRFIPAHWSLTLDWCGPKKCQNTYLSSRPERSEVERSVVYVRNRRSLHSALLSLRCGKPQISPLRFAPVEMTKLGVIADQTFLNPIFIPMGGLQAHEHSGRDDKVRCSCQPSLPQPDFHPLGWAAGLRTLRSR